VPKICRRHGTAVRRTLDQYQAFRLPLGWLEEPKQSARRHRRGSAPHVWLLIRVARSSVPHHCLRTRNGETKWQHDCTPAHRSRSAHAASQDLVGEALSPRGRGARSLAVALGRERLTRRRDRPRRRRGTLDHLAHRLAQLLAIRTAARGLRDLGELLGRERAAAAGHAGSLRAALTPAPIARGHAGLHRASVTRTVKAPSLGHLPKQSRAARAVIAIWRGLIAGAPRADSTCGGPCQATWRDRR